VELERLHDLRVAEVQHLWPLLHDRDAGAERGEHGGVLDADHPCPDDDERCGHALQAQHRVGVEHPLIVELDLGWTGRLRAGGDDDVLRRDDLEIAARLTLDGHGVRVLEPGDAAEDVHVVAQELVADHLDLAADHMLCARQQVLDRDLALDAIAHAVQVPLGEPGEVEDCLAQRLGRDRAGVDADAAHHVAPLGDGHAFAQLGCGDRCLLAAGPGADHQQVVVIHGTVLPHSAALSAPQRCGQDAPGQAADVNTRARHWHVTARMPAGRSPQPAVHLGSCACSSTAERSNGRGTVSCPTLAP
jgi:hypothetical protein